MAKQQQEEYFDAHPSYRGGHTTIYGRYIFELSPGHPLANRWGYVAQHRLIAEDLVGRPLIQSDDPNIRECVHHKDENPLNNSPENLEVMTFSEHRRHHTRKRNEEAFAKRRPTREAAGNALAATPNIKEAAKLLGICHQTLRQHFPDLVAPYKRRSPTNPHRPSENQLLLLRQIAASDKMGEREAKKALGLSGNTIRKICRLHGIHWVRKSRKGEKHRRRKPIHQHQVAGDSPTESA